MPARQTVLVGDALTRLRELADGSVHVAITSPPYFQQRDYATGTWTGGDPACDHKPGNARRVGATTLGGGTATSGHQQEGYRDTCPKCGARREDAQLGQEAWPDCLGWATGNACGCCYVCKLVAVFREVKRVLRSDGVCFINLGDSFSSQLTSSGRYAIADICPEVKVYFREVAPPDLKPKDLCGIPWRVALALQADGWYLRSEIIWSKLAPLPESVTDRPTRSHEQIFLFSKSERYYFDADAVKEPFADARMGNPGGGKRNYAPGNRNDATDSAFLTWNADGEKTGRNLRSVWVLGPEPSTAQFCAACHTLYTGPERRKPGQACRCGATDKWVAHFAAFVSAIPRRAILAGSSEMGCCPKCGSPWARIVERTDQPAAGMKGSTFDTGKTGARDGGDRTQPGPRYAKRATGWKPGCTCLPAPPIPATVLFPFVGSGTTLLVAQELGRAGIGIDLRPEYAALTQARLARAGQQPALLEVTDV